MINTYDNHLHRCGCSSGVRWAFIATSGDGFDEGPARSMKAPLRQQLVHQCSPRGKTVVEKYIPGYLTKACKKSRNGMPKEFMKKKLRKGQWRAVQNRNGVMVVDGLTREVQMLSTASGSDLNSGTKTFRVAECYNKIVRFFDPTDHMAAYSPFFRQTKNGMCILLFLAS
ncbi:hypothetical protein KIN20_022140 [Parelaphostrongylus tenuis]|uniref:Uncharacterized protein n=1 Tax=Parelaphostrongylus tenuis TaxID=148309 RepID=A0AAD5QV66_PARTN|nr:hypothetical protein KIN20_022140 [Parelaphostrongylus tenuis]